MLLASGLQKFAQAMMEFETYGDFGAIVSNAIAAISFAAGELLLASPMILIAAALAGVPLMILGMGLMKFALAMQEFSYVGEEAIAGAVASIRFFADEMGVVLAIKIAALGTAVGIPLMIFGMGLMKFAEGLIMFNNIGAGAIITMVNTLLFFTDQIGFLGALELAAVFGLVAFPLWMFATGLMTFAEALFEFNFIGQTEMDLAVNGLMMFLDKIGAQEGFVAYIMGAIGWPLYYFALGLQMFGLALQAFNDVSSEAIDVSIDALTRFLTGTAGLAFYAPFMTMLAPALWLMGWGLSNLGGALDEVMGYEEIMISLGTFFGGLGAFSMASVAAVWLLGGAISNLAGAISQIPSEKIINFGASMDGLKPLLEATTKLTPEGVELTAKVVEQAGIYQKGQIEMQESQGESWIDKIFGKFTKTKSGTAPAAAGGKTEVVLVLNDREFGRAVIDAVEKKMNLNID